MSSNSPVSFEFVTDYDTSGGDINFSDLDEIMDVGKYATFSVAIRADTIAGGADGKVILMSSPTKDFADFQDIILESGDAAEITLDTDDSNNIINVDKKVGKYMMAKFEANAVTSGTIDLILDATIK